MNQKYNIDNSSLNAAITRENTYDYASDFKQKELHDLYNCIQDTSELGLFVMKFVFSHYCAHWTVKDICEIFRKKNYKVTYNWWTKKMTISW